MRVSDAKRPAAILIPERAVIQLTIPITSCQVNDLVALALCLGARDVAGWSSVEEALKSDADGNLDASAVARARQGIQAGQDPLGDAYSELFSAAQRRPRGATYTPHAIVHAMLSWAAERVAPRRIVDPGTGSGRFLVAAGRLFPDAELIGVEADGLAAMLARAHLSAAGLAGRARVEVCDYREFRLRPIDGPTLFTGNPPYVRHHDIDPRWKEWLTRSARRRGIRASQLAGLHAHFFLATATLAAPGDIGVFVTAAEWLDVNYGSLIRELLAGELGLLSLHVVEPTSEPFPGTATTAVITHFEVGSQQSSIGTERIHAIGTGFALGRNGEVGRQTLMAAPRWSQLLRTPRDRCAGYVELGELCRVHRGQVTGANRIWIAGPSTPHLPSSVLFPTVTRAREILAADQVLRDAGLLRRVIDLPVDLGALSAEEQARVSRFLTYAASRGADRGYIATHRKSWWSVGLRDPAPVLATYMARKPPKFIVNAAGARHINIAHGLYPREPMSEDVQLALVTFLNGAVSVSDGRTYAGGLTKFEPGEMERLLVPRPEELAAAARG